MVAPIILHGDRGYLAAFPGRTATYPRILPDTDIRRRVTGQRPASGPSTRQKLALELVDGLAVLYPDERKILELLAKVRILLVD